MAFDLTARLRLLDNMTAPLRRATAQVKQTSRIIDEMSGSLTKTTRAQDLTGKSALSLARSIDNIDSAMGATKVTMTTLRDSAGRLRDEFGRFVSSNSRVGGVFYGIANGASKARGAVLGLKSAIGGIVGVAAGYGLYRGTESFLTSALGGAAQYELAQVQIEALFGDAKKAKTYMDRMSAAAAASPILNEQDVFANSKSFLALTKDQKVLEDMWKVAEKLNAMDPAQGLEGAVLAMRELAGGDVVSLVERFELPRSVVNQWKNLPIDKQAKAMNKYLDQLGFNQKFLEKTGQTAAKQWDRTQELISKGMRMIGQDALTKLRPALVQLNDFLSGPRFAVFVDKAGRALADMFDGMLAGARSAWTYLDRQYLSNPQFKKLTTMQARINFVIDDLMGAFRVWLDSGGQDMLNKIGNQAVGVLSKAIEDGAPRLAQAGLVVGKALGTTIIDAAVKEFDKLFTDPMQYGVNFQQRKANNAQATFGFLNVTPPTAADIVERTERSRRNMKWFDDMLKSVGIGSGATTPVIYGPPVPPKIDGSHYNGLDYVPYDGYIARLHRGERVLTRQENEQYSGGKGGSVSMQFGDIHLHGVGGDLEGAAEHFMAILAKRLREAGIHAAGVY
ncbi:hypothetical protein M4D57_20245 [Brevibacillus borstelensis]|uniref:hypothetical protein n=1 Tax=Brevibacillus borstelensis TaxID=45462 RepID=UPI0020420358|nr:hypothetical protein [Brevibacillus borstelensis]MCM3560898.1 hypothetical protein [Brevibacillus borstelensis]